MMQPAFSLFHSSPLLPPTSHIPAFWEYVQINYVQANVVSSFALGESKLRQYIFGIVVKVKFYLYLKENN